MVLFFDHAFLTGGAAKVVGASGVGGEVGKVVTDVVAEGAKVTAKALKENDA